MTNLTLTKVRLNEGVWEGALTREGGEDTPELEAMHLGQPIEGIDVTDSGTEGEWLVKLSLPASVLSEGVQTILIREAGAETALESITLIAGEALAYDVRAEVALLREELDLLKRSYRRFRDEN